MPCAHALRPGEAVDAPSEESVPMTATTRAESSALLQATMAPAGPAVTSLQDAILRSQAVAEFDLDGQLLAANDLFLRLLGYTLPELLGQPHRLLCPAPAEGEPCGPAWELLRAGQPQCGDYLRVAKDGRRLWLQASYQPVLDAKGQPARVLLFCSDITAARIAAIETAARMAAVSASNCLIEFDGQGCILAVNPLMCEALGYAADELIGKPEAFILFDDTPRDAGYQARWRQLHAGQVAGGECRRRGAGDRTLWLRATMTPAMGLDGQLARVVMVGQDITAAKLAQLDAAAKIAAIDRAQAVIEFDLQGHVLQANANFLELMGYQFEEIKGRHHRLFVDAEEAATPAYQAFWERLGRGEFESAEYRRVGKGGREVWIRASYNPVFDPLGRPLKVVKFASDVTAAKLRAAEFEAKVAAIDLGQAVIEFDLDGKVLQANRNFLVAMGYTLREVQGHHHSIFCTAEYTQSPEYRDFWLKLGEGQFVSGRFHRVGKFSRDVWIQATYNPIFDLNGKVSKIVKFAYDVSNEVQLERSIASQSAHMQKSVQGLVQSITAIAANSGVAAEMAQESASAAQSGFDALQKSIAAIGAIQTSSSRVTEIVRVIGDIASQTNLLAFNAAIEAARAGAHGVGFSVVAGKVRRLAERSSAAAREINALIDESVQQVERGASVSANAARSFEGIQSSVTRTGASVSAIAAAAEEQRRMAGEVSELIQALTRQVTA